MKIKQYLREQAEKDAEALLTERDGQFIKELTEDNAIYAEKPSFVRVITLDKRRTIAAVLGVAIIVAAAIILPFVLKGNNIDAPTYKNEDIIERSSTYQELNSDLQYFSLSEGDYNIILNYDSVSGDKLFYIVKGTFGIADFELTIVTNKNYNYNFHLDNNQYEEELNYYNLNYCVNIISDFELYEIGYLGVIELNTEKVYLEYNQIIDVGKEAFFQDLQNVLTVKN